MSFLSRTDAVWTHKRRRAKAVLLGSGSSDLFDPLPRLADGKLEAVRARALRLPGLGPPAGVHIGGRLIYR